MVVQNTYYHLYLKKNHLHHFDCPNVLTSVLVTVDRKTARYSSHSIQQRS